MKKALVVIMALVIMTLCSVSALAAPTNFVSSPEENKAPVIVDVTNEDEDCTATVNVTPYSQRKNLSSNSRTNMEKAYKNITETPDLSKLDKDLEDAAKKQGLDGDDLAVSDIFNLEYDDCVEHDEHGNFKIKLTADTLKGFVGLMRFDGEKWTYVKGAAVTDGTYLTFTADKLDNFAIIVKKDTVSPATGDFVSVAMTVAMLVSLCGVAVVGRKLREVEAN